nr:DUF58 domain-containing protein [Luteimonas sp. BDR2-5]
MAELLALRTVPRGRGGARRASAGVRQQALALQRGHGMEYAESREYVAGDDARHIDWRVTARTGRAHTKTFQVERERLSLIVADTAPALYFGTRQRFKSVQAARAGAIAAWAAVAEGDRIAALRGTVSEPPVPPGNGPRGALRVLDALVRWYTAPPADDLGLAVALDHARRLLRPGSRMLVLADPGSVAAIAPERWTALAAHNEVLVLLLSDPLEREPPRRRLAFTQDGNRLELDLAAAPQRARWRQAFADPLDAALAMLHARGVRAAMLSTDTPGDAWLPLFGRPKAA